MSDLRTALNALAADAVAYGQGSWVGREIRDLLAAHPAPEADSHVCTVHCDEGHYPAPVSNEATHGPWDKSSQRYEDGCKEDRPHPDTRREDHLDAACAWSDFRKDYGVSGDDKVRRQEHRAFMAGWQSARGTIDTGGVQR